MLSKSDFPQADHLKQVGEVAIAVHNQRRTDKEIEAYIGLDSAGRQGRYYRQAAKVLGLISSQHNHAVLTPLGAEYASLTSSAARTDFLARCLIDTPVFREALIYIRKHKPTDHQLKVWFRAFYPGAQSTADRRFVTFQNYLRDARLLKRSGASNDLGKYTGGVVKQSTSSTVGLAGRKVKKTIATTPIYTTTGSIRVDIDMQKRERANQTHWQLIAAKSSFLEDRGLQPYENEHIDLYTNMDGDIILYEMKSVDPGLSNLLAQVRKAVAQLYEYRYIYSEPAARLCIVTNAGVAKKDDWLVDYLAKDRSIAYEWTEDFTIFQCHAGSKLLLGSFAPDCKS